MRSMTSLGLFFLFTCATLSFAVPGVVKMQDTVVATNAMTLGSGAPYGYAINGLSFQQDMLLTHNGWQYAAYYNGSRRLCVARRQLPSGAWSVITFTDYLLSTITNAHCVVSLGICPNDGTLHLAFDQHSNALKYRASEPGVATNPASVTWSTARFGAVRDYLENGVSMSVVTYPRFIQTPDGNLQYGFRTGSSGNGDWGLVDYSAATGLWSNTRIFIGRTGTYTDSQGSSTSRCPYENGPILYGPDGALHLTWTWRESAGGANHDIAYASSTDGGFTWYNNNPPAGFRIGAGGGALQDLLSVTWVNAGNQVIADTDAQQLITVASPDANVVVLDRYYGMMNQQAQAVDALGRIHTVMFHCTPESYVGYAWSLWGPQGARRYYHYWRDEQGVWTRNEMPGWVGSRPKLYIRENGDAYAIYQSRQSQNATNTGIYFTDGNLTIQAATAAAQWTDWQIVHTETGPFLNEALADPVRFHDGILSVVMQESPGTVGASTSLRVLDFQMN